MMEYFTADDGARIAYRDTGSGQPLICLSGLTRNSADFDYLAPHLDGVRMICMDYRGRGASDWSGAASYTVLREAQDVIGLYTHLGLASAPILGTSRGGLVALMLAAMAADRVAGVCFNDIGPEVESVGLGRISDYIGRNPRAKTHAEAAAALAHSMTGFANVPENRWLQEARRHYTETPEGLKINYDPALRDAFLAAYEVEQPDIWPLYDLLAAKPVALIRGANSDLLSPRVVAQMARRHPGMIHAEVPDRAHVPFLDEPEALAAIRAFLAEVQ
ncbi:MAG: alpha/beta hydrolase [Confluentimicrobium sp.]|uniref:alpha/beta fold hydrolase n=1 Tax=Actibacterium sp. TaxID=1872125 RepID=UPI00050F03B0|nr:alpha/beta hydrolase [Actibacterium sp.]KGB81635.1 hydrolase [Rhodovulum sp. NI22]MBC56487.1 alpha/beta hydrolase [Actibacterium sp.]